MRDQANSVGTEFGSDYELVWLKKRGKEIGEVRSYTVDRKNCRRIPITHDEEQIREGRETSFIYWDGQCIRIIVGEEFLSFLDDLKRTLIWHEVGHVHHGHHNHMRDDDARIMAVKNGRVPPREMEADKFAVSQVGKKAMLKLLRFLIRTRPKGDPGSLNALGHRELELRIKNIKSL